MHFRKPFNQLACPQGQTQRLRIYSIVLVAASISCVGRGYRASQRTADELLFDLQRSSDAGVRAAAARRLGDLKERRAVEPLLTVLGNSPVEALSRSAIYALGELRDGRAVDGLVNVLRFGTRPMKGLAARALGKIHDIRSVDPLAAELANVGEEAGKALASIGEPSVPPLIRCLRQPDTREYAVTALAAIGPSAVEPLIHALRTERESGRYAAARALAEIRDRRAEAALLDALRGEDLKLAAATYRFLIRSGSSEAENLLKKVLTEYGNFEMAQDFVACGNKRLGLFAESWETEHGFVPEKLPAERSAVTWASMP